MRTVHDCKYDTDAKHEASHPWGLLKRPRAYPAFWPRGVWHRCYSIHRGKPVQVDDDQLDEHTVQSCRNHEPYSIANVLDSPAAAITVLRFLAMSGDAEYLKATVGAALAQGVAECVCAGPDDPVAFLGNWLKAHVQNSSIKQQVSEENALIAAEAEQAAHSRALIEESERAIAAQRTSVVEKVGSVPRAQPA